MDILNTVVSWLGNAVNIILDFVSQALPDSPFTLLDNSPISDILGYINYFVPVAFILDILLVWGTCIVIYFAYSALMRWFKIIE